MAMDARFLDPLRARLLLTPPDFAGARALLPKAATSVTRLASLVVDAGEIRVVEGSLAVEERVALGVDALLWVLGDCDIQGSVYSHDFDYSMLCVGGRLKAKAIRTGGEIFALEGLEAGTLWGQYNDYSTYAPKAVCDLYIADDRRDILPGLTATARHTRRLDDATLKKLFPGLQDGTSESLRAYFARV